MKRIHVCILLLAAVILAISLFGRIFGDSEKPPDRETAKEVITGIWASEAEPATATQDLGPWLSTNAGGAINLSSENYSAGMTVGQYAAYSSAMPEDTCIWGDANGSGGCDQDDAVYLISHLCSDGPAPMSECGDVDTDCDVDIFDVDSIIRHCYGLGNLHPPGCDDPVTVYDPREPDTITIEYNSGPFLNDDRSVLFVPILLSNDELLIDIQLDLYLTEWFSIGFVDSAWLEYAGTRLEDPTILPDRGEVSFDTIGGYRITVTMSGDSANALVSGSGSIGQLTLALSYPPFCMTDAQLLPTVDPGLSNSIRPLRMHLPGSTGYNCFQPHLNVGSIWSLPLLIGDANGSGEIDIDDVVYIISYIFSGGPAPVPHEVASGDANCSCGVDIDDVVYLIGYIFSGGPPPCTTEEWLQTCCN